MMMMIMSTPTPTAHNQTKGRTGWAGPKMGICLCYPFWHTAKNGFECCDRQARAIEFQYLYSMDKHSKSLVSESSTENSDSDFFLHSGSFFLYLVDINMLIHQIDQTAVSLSYKCIPLLVHSPLFLAVAVVLRSVLLRHCKMGLTKLEGLKIAWTASTITPLHDRIQLPVTFFGSLLCLQLVKKS